VNDLATRLRDAGAALLDLRGPLVRGEPWPLSAAYGTEPEADWGPREVLAHVNEMLPYWTAQLEGVLAADPSAPAPFGGSRRTRTGSPGSRRIAGRPRAGCLMHRCRARDRWWIRGGAVRGGPRADRTASDPGASWTIGASIDRFLVTHLEEHVAQLREILARRGG
jgi:hypothetical protein